MAKQLSISIVTICYQAAALLEATMQSVLNSDCPGLEYIVIDGGSNDGTADIIKRYSPKLTYALSEEDEGISDAFNKGITQCNGELIGLLNAGDRYEEGALQHIAENYNGADVVYADLLTITDGQASGTYHPHHEGLRTDMTLCHPSVFVRKDAYARWGDYRRDYKLAMDYELLLRFHEAGASFQKLDFTTTVMNMEGISNAHWKEALQEVHRAQEEHLETSVFRDVKAKFKVTKRSIGKRLESSPLEGLLAGYRKRFSKVKKD